MRISNYDKNHYDYRDYWKQRRYEDISERVIMNKFFHNEQGAYFFDIGGSFGRNTPSYIDKYKTCVIGDYSLETLQKNYKELRSKYKNLELVALNVYNLPFKTSVFDGALMVRVLHHIENTNKYINEIKRVMNGGSVYIQEYANKMHFKAITRAILTFNFSFFNTDHYQQPTRGNNEGNGRDGDNVFLNFHPTHINKLLRKAELIQEDRFGASYFRVPILKRLFKPEFLYWLEIIFQNIFKYTYLAPSIFIKTRKRAVKKITKTSDIQEILCCPKCKESLSFTKSRAKCNRCKSLFFKKKNIWDFRV